MAQNLNFGQVIKMSCRFSASNAFNTGTNHMEFIEKLGELDVKMKLTQGFVAEYLLHRNHWCSDVSRKPCGMNTFFEHDERM